MRKLSSLILLLTLSVTLFSQKSPHGDSFKTNCTNCHNTSGWKIDLKKLSFDHSTTKFPLTGQHQAVTCKLCHNSLEFSKVGKECISCHTDMHNQTVGSDCERCHTPVSWVVNNITEIHQRSRFPLVGAHVTADCFDCHTNATSNLLLFGPLGIECVDCHMDEYTATTNPNHVAGAYSTNCTQCHNMSAISWTGAGINHNFFPLTGGHEINDCQQCHKTPDYSSTSPECISCHQADYNATTNPNHAAINITTECESCHTTQPGWKPATFPTHNNYYQLEGAHMPIANSCNDCHNGNYNETPNTCVGCHLEAYNQTTNPPHVASQFPTSCLDCHTQNGWTPATWDHDNLYFPIYSGEHEGEWDACSDCHPNPGNYALFTCTTACHPQSEMNNEHQGVSGYSYTSTACLNCHPDGGSSKMMNKINKND